MDLLQSMGSYTHEHTPVILVKAPKKALKPGAHFRRRLQKGSGPGYF